MGIGDVPTLEVLAAADILQHEIPERRLRVVNVTDLLILEKESEHPHGLDTALFEALFTPDAPVIVNFHGYSSAVKQPFMGVTAARVSPSATGRKAPPRLLRHARAQGVSH